MKRSWCNLFQNVYRRSLSSDLEAENRSLQTRDPQGLRRPRFSFFIFTCQTARRQKSPSPCREFFEVPTRRQMTTDGVSVVRFTHPNEELHGHENMPWPRAKTAPRSVGRVISPPDRRCQRLLSTNRRLALPVSRRKEASIFAGFAPYLSHNPATFWHTSNS